MELAANEALRDMAAAREAEGRARAQLRDAEAVAEAAAEALKAMEVRREGRKGGVWRTRMGSFGRFSVGISTSFPGAYGTRSGRGVVPCHQR